MATVSMNKAEVLWLVGLVGSVATFLYAHGLQFDATTMSGLAILIFGWFKKSPFTGA